MGLYRLNRLINQLNDACDLSNKILFKPKDFMIHWYFQALKSPKESRKHIVLIDFSLTVKAATLIFIPVRGSAISSAKEGKSGSIYNLVNN